MSCSDCDWGCTMPGCGQKMSFCAAHYERMADRAERAEERADALLRELRQELTDIADEQWECRRCGATIGIWHDTTDVPHAATCILATPDQGKGGR